MREGMVMFFNWGDLWLAVTIISPFTRAGWKKQAGQLEPEGIERESGKGANQSHGKHRAGGETMKKDADEL